jgi:hypothetical protein
MAVINKSMNKSSITLKINGQDVVIEKLPLRRIAEVFKALEKLPSKFAEKFGDTGFKDVPNDKVLEMLPEIIGESLPEVAKLISVATPLTEDQVLDELGLAEAIEVLTAISQVNDFSKVVENVKKLLARNPETNPNSKNTGSTGPLTS